VGVGICDGYCISQCTLSLSLPNIFWSG